MNESPSSPRDLTGRPLSDPKTALEFPIRCDLVASTGIHDGKAVIKQLLAGAKAVQVVSALYKNGRGHIRTMLEELETWMNQHGHGKLDDFRGKMSQEKSANPAVYERVQFMKYFGGEKEIT